MIILEPNEKILLIKRRHLPVVYLEMSPLALFLIIIIIGMIVTLNIVPSQAPEFLVKIFYPLLEVNFKYFVIFILSLLFFILWQFLFIIFSYYYLDCWIITNQRTVHTELIRFFSRFDSSVPHDQIQDVSIDVHGFLPTVLKYGDLNIQTAGSFRKFIFYQIHNPYETKRMLLQARDELIAQHSSK